MHKALEAYKLVNQHISLCNMFCVGKKKGETFLEAERWRLRTEMLVAGKQEAE